MEGLNAGQEDEGFGGTDHPNTSVILFSQQWQHQGVQPPYTQHSSHHSPAPMSVPLAVLFLTFSNHTQRCGHAALQPRRLHILKRLHQTRYVRSAAAMPPCNPGVFTSSSGCIKHAMYMNRFWRAKWNSSVHDLASQHTERCVRGTVPYTLGL